MQLSNAQSKQIAEALTGVVQKLRAANIQPSTVADFVPAKKWSLFRRKAKFTQRLKAWRLGVFLIGEGGELFAVGETTRAVAPGYPGHTSSERERRRGYTKAAFISGFPLGEVIYFDSKLVDTGQGSEPPASSPLVVLSEGLRVRWNPGTPDTMLVDFNAYLAEQVELRIGSSASRE